MNEEIKIEQINFDERFFYQQMKEWNDFLKEQEKEDVVWESDKQ